MAVRAAIALSLAALAWAALPSAGSAWAEDDPACAQYHEPMAYNACLARHGPKANGVGTLSRQFRSAAAGETGRQDPSSAGRASSALMGACTWSFASSERRLKLASAAPEPAEIAQAPRSSPRAVGEQREDRASHQAPRRVGAGS